MAASQSSLRLIHPRGQGATEYLVLLAIVLIIAMVAVQLLSFLADSSFSARSAQSDSYWRYQAKPFTVAYHGLSSDGILKLVMVNVQGDSLRVDGISVAGSGINGTYSGPFYLPAGQPTLVSLDMGPAYPAGTVYEFRINISYGELGPNPLNQTQFGSQSLIGRASDKQDRVQSSPDDRVCPQCIVCEDNVCRSCRGSECD